MSLTREQRDELRAEMKFPWYEGENAWHLADVRDAEGNPVAWPYSRKTLSATRAIIALIVAVPSLLDALDAAEARNAELEVEVVSWAIRAGERRKQEARP